MLKQFFVAAVAFASVTACKSDDGKKPAADNTERNERDTAKTPTADQAVNSSSDLEITQAIRKAVMADDTLSTNAHNAKIVVQDGAVTLVGPVASADEKARMEQIASKVTGAKSVANQLEVAN